MNEALRANDLHVKSMQRHDRQLCGAIRANYDGANRAFGTFDAQFARVEKI